MRLLYTCEGILGSLRPEARCLANARGVACSLIKRNGNAGAGQAAGFAAKEIDDWQDLIMLRSWANGSNCSARAGHLAGGGGGCICWRRDFAFCSSAVFSPDRAAGVWVTEGAGGDQRVLRDRRRIGITAAAIAAGGGVGIDRATDRGLPGEYVYGGESAADGGCDDSDVGAVGAAAAAGSFYRMGVVRGAE